MKFRQEIQRYFVALLLTLGLIAPVAADSKTPLPSITVYKSATCGCCEGWVDHLREEGFTVVVADRDDMPAIKASFGVPRDLQSCHTAKVEGYVIEGHVPASDIKALLLKMPAVTGLTAPGMPMRSPGMQEPGLPPKGYDVLSFNKSGKKAVFSRH
jgi:hypothetical protein